MYENDKLMRRAEDLANTALYQCRYTCTGYLSIEEQDCIRRKMCEARMHKWTFCGGNESSVRRFAVFGSKEDIGYEFEPPVCVILIEPVSERFAQELSHRDYLGALMSLGIERSTMGDIIVKGKKAWLYCFESIAEYIAANLTSVRHTSVRCSISDPDVPDLKPELKELKINIPSQRIDAVTAALINTSRTKAQELIKDERVFINGAAAASAGRTLSEGDTVVIRGFGKFIFDGIASTTKKGRIYAALRKYV